MNQKGFTLIELLVSIGILLVMFGMGLINYLGFREEQKMTQSKNMVKEAVIDAQNASRSGKLFGCDQLEFYQLEFANGDSSGEIAVRSICSDETTSSEKDYTLSDGVKFLNSPLSFTILPVNGIIDIINPATVTLDLDSRLSESLCIHRSGIVEQGACP